MDANGNDVKGQAFELPTGARVDTDNGDYVVKDSSGNIVFRWNESAAEWQLNGTDLTGVGSLSADEASITETLARALQTSDQTMSSGTVTKIHLDSVPVDDFPDDKIEIDISNNTIIIKEPGVYLLNGSVSLDIKGSSATSVPRYQLTIKQDGTTIQTAENPVSENVIPTREGTAMQRYTDSELPVTVYVNVYQDSGIDIDTNTGVGFLGLEVARLG